MANGPRRRQEAGSASDTGYAEALCELDAGSPPLGFWTPPFEEGVEKVSVDFTQPTEGFYFQESNLDLPLARPLPYALLSWWAGTRRVGRPRMGCRGLCGFGPGPLSRICIILDFCVTTSADRSIRSCPPIR